MPREIDIEGKQCTAVGAYYEVTGLTDPTVARKLNARLERTARNRSGCTDEEGDAGPGSVENYELNEPLLLGKFLIFSQNHDEDAGGTHPDADGASLVLNLETGSEVNLLSYLKPGKAAAFSRAVGKKLAEENDDEEDIGQREPIKSAHIYPTGAGLTVRFSPSEVGAYGLGFVDTEFSAQESRRFFKSNADTHALFGI